MQEEARPCLFIPVRSSHESVQIFIDELPDDIDELIDIFSAELAPLDVWHKFAVEYYKQGKIQHFLGLLEQGVDPMLDEYYRDSKTERIAFFNALASYYTQQGVHEKDKKRREESFDKATQYFNKADRMDPHDPLSWVGKGVLMVCRGKLDQALTSFDGVLENQDANYVPALLGKACVMYAKERYKEALELYQRAIKTNPMCPASVRLGLGHCYARLGKPHLARQAFQRVLQLEEDNVEALAGLAVLELNDKEGDMRKYAADLKKAYELNSSNSMVLNHLANYFFFKKDYSKTHTLATSAFHNTEVSQIKAESCYYLARCYHAQEDYDNAYKFYFQAVKHKDDHALSLYGLGLMYVQREEHDKAIQSFEKVLTHCPDDCSTLRVLGSLFAQRDNSMEKAKSYLKKATELRPDDPETWMELAQLLEKSDQSGSLAAYERALAILQKRAAATEGERSTIPAELLNNIGVLRQQQGKVRDAIACFLGAIEISGHDVSQYRAVNVTSTYNLARAYEAMDDLAAAEELYKGILKAHPNYIDCYLRMGCIARERGHADQALEWFKDAFTIKDDHIGAWTLIGNMHLAKDEFQPAQKKYERILQVGDKNDPYSLLALGNIFYQAKFNTPDKEAKYLKLAKDFYTWVLDRYPSNVYAATGIAIIFAERGDLKEAREFFAQVREATPAGSSHMIDVMIDLAHVYLAQGQFANAVHLYQNGIRSIFGAGSTGQGDATASGFGSGSGLSGYVKDPATVYSYLAKAYFEWKKFEECQETLQRAIRCNPSNLSLWFDLALSQSEHAAWLLQRDNKARIVQHLETAVHELEMSARTFEWLGQQQKNPGNAKQVNYSVSKAQKFGQKAKETLQKARAQHAVEVERENSRIQQREEQLAMVDSARRERQKIEEEKMAEEEKQREKLLRMAEEDERRSEELGRLLAIEMENSSSRRSRQKAADSEEDEADAEAGGSKKKGKRKGKGRKKRADNEDDEQREDAPQEGVERPEEEEEEEEEEPLRDSRNDKLKQLAKRVKENKKAKKRRSTKADDDDAEDQPNLDEVEESSKRRRKEKRRQSEEDDQSQEKDDAEGPDADGDENMAGGDEPTFKELKRHIKECIDIEGKDQVTIKRVMAFLQTRLGDRMDLTPYKQLVKDEATRIVQSEATENKE